MFFFNFRSGPKIQLLRLRVSELPDHTRTQIPSTVDPDCDPTDNMIIESPSEGSINSDSNRARGPRRRNNRGRVRRPVETSESSTINKPQSDTSMSDTDPKSENLKDQQKIDTRFSEPVRADPVHKTSSATKLSIGANSLLITLLLLLGINFVMHWVAYNWTRHLSYPSLLKLYRIYISKNIYC